MSFSNDIKMIRHKCLMSQIEFAEALGVSFATVNRWESGRSKHQFHNRLNKRTEQDTDIIYT